MSKIGIFIPTLNRADLLLQALPPLFEQKDDFEVLLILDNGNQNIKPVNDKCVVATSEYNYGVSKSWNIGISYIFNNYRDVTHVLVLNDDIVLGNKQIKDIRSVIDNNPDKWFYVGPYYWSVYAISRDGAKAMEYAPDKYFDEKIYPAYFEDNDFHYRLRLIDETKYLGNLSPMTPEVCRNSMTLAKDRTVNSRFSINKSYYIQKWGGAPGMETFKTPFNRGEQCF